MRGSGNQDFLRGYIACLVVVTEGARDVNGHAREAWNVLGHPTAEEIRRAGITDLDAKVCNALRKEFRHAER